MSLLGRMSILKILFCMYRIGPLPSDPDTRKTSLP